jgi:hypothetical protein
MSLSSRRKDPTQRFIELLEDVGEDGIADMIVSACEVAYDGAEDEETADEWRAIALTAESLRDRIARMTRKT